MDTFIGSSSFNDSQSQRMLEWATTLSIFSHPYLTVSSFFMARDGKPLVMRLLFRLYIYFGILWVWTILSLYWICYNIYLFYVLVSQPRVCGFLAPRWGIELVPLAVEASGLNWTSRKSLRSLYIFKRRIEAFYSSCLWGCSHVGNAE